jgi:hypothetical protein
MNRSSTAPENSILAAINRRDRASQALLLASPAGRHRPDEGEARLAPTGPCRHRPDEGEARLAPTGQ